MVYSQGPRIAFALGCRVENSGTKLSKGVENSTSKVGSIEWIDNTQNGINIFEKHYVLM